VEETENNSEQLHKQMMYLMEPTMLLKDMSEM